MEERLVRALIFFAVCGMCGSVFFLPLLLALRKPHLRAAGRPRRAQLDPVVVINAAIGVYVISSLWLIYSER